MYTDDRHFMKVYVNLTCYTHSRIIWIFYKFIRVNMGKNLIYFVYRIFNVTRALNFSEEWDIRALHQNRKFFAIFVLRRRQTVTFTTSGIRNGTYTNKGRRAFIYFFNESKKREEKFIHCEFLRFFPRSFSLPPFLFPVFLLWHVVSTFRKL